MKIINIKNEFQELEILTTGATIHQWKAFSDRRNILISNKNFEDYKKVGTGYFNQTVGRFANRIKDGKFELNGIDYQLSKNFAGGNHGHGGPTGFFLREFDVIYHDETEVKLRYVSPHMEEGYPGELTLIVGYKLIDDKMKLTFEAVTTEDTIINITNHAHFNLSLEPTILNHSLMLDASKVLKTDEFLVPNGEYLDVTNTKFDLRNPALLKDVINDEKVRLNANGLDHSYILNDSKKAHLKYKDKNLVVTTMYPGFQVYSMNHPVKQQLLNDRVFEYHAGIALEPQFEPNGINIKHFNQPILRKNETYYLETIYHVFEE